MRAGITEKRLTNKRFRKTEDALLKVFLEEDGYIGIGAIAMKAGVARSTVYLHHRAAREIVPDYEEYIMRRYRRIVRKMLKVRGVKLRTMYLKILSFIVADKRIFDMLLRVQGNRIFERMLEEIRVKLIVTMGLPKNSQRMFAVYESEVVKLICEWGNSGFREEEMGKLLMEIMYFTDTVRDRLDILLD